MKVEGPQIYELFFDCDEFRVRCSKGTAKFSGLATRTHPKLYVVSVKKRIIYVGITRQSLRSRLRLGFSANGKNGYHGYKWRHEHKKAKLHVWSHEDAPVENPDRDMETVEAEIVFLIRKAREWPAGQTEIHFHRSKPRHRKLAEKIWRKVTSVVSG